MAQQKAVVQAHEQLRGLALAADWAVVNSLSMGQLETDGEQPDIFRELHLERAAAEYEGGSDRAATLHVLDSVTG